VHVNKEAQLPPFPRIVDASFESAMKQESNPVLVRARMWAWAPEELRARTWPKLETVLTTHAEAAGLDPARAFPAPSQAGGIDDPVKKTEETAGAVGLTSS
jgi:hypothetical protein